MLHHEASLMNRRSTATKSTQELARVQRDLAQARQELETLYAALDNVDSGLLVLSSDLRALYSNPSLHVMFKSLSSEQFAGTNRSMWIC
jgi:hypothetical protein